MDKLAREFADQAHFIFVYVREAHPDMFPDHPAHKSIEQKLRHAEDLQEKFNTPRTVLVDSLDGDVHRAYAGLPNMSWIVDATGRIVYKAAWTVAEDIREALNEAFRARELKRMRAPSYYKETVSSRPMRDPAMRRRMADMFAGQRPRSSSGDFPHMESGERRPRPRPDSDAPLPQRE